MRFHVLLPVRDEADIIDQCLTHLLKWADAIYVFDTGSVDQTWEIVQAHAAKDRRVIPLKKDPVFYSEVRLRGWMFHQARQHMRDGDWFLRADADEFHHIFPKEFIETRMRPGETIAFHQYYNFELLESEVQAWESGQVTLADRQRPIEQRRRWFRPSFYSEPRLCKYRETMQWSASVSFPYNAGFVARERLPIRHYPHRDPAQLARRYLLRAIMMADKENSKDWTQPELHHWSQREWRKFIVPDNTPDLLYWKEGEALPVYHFTNHLMKPHVRFAQRMAHTFLLPILDRRRPKWPADYYPQRIPADLVERLERDLGP